MLKVRLPQHLHIQVRTSRVKPPRFLYLPMEVFVREYDSRLLIALMAIERGMEVILGQKWLMEKNARSMPAGLWIFKTMTLRDSRIMQRVKEAGHAITSIDEEVPGFAEGSGGLMWVSPSAVATCDRIFCVGPEHQKSMEQKWPDHAHRLAATGNPRWDYLRPELSSVYGDLAKKYRSEHGRIILINTNIGETNSAKYRDSKQSTEKYISRGKLDPTSKADIEIWEQYLEFERNNFKSVVSLAPKLARKFSGHTIVVRPHPAENIETYRKLFADIGNIKVLFDGPAAAWIVASDVLVHTACTTGAEAYALGKPTINFETMPSRWHNILLAGQLNLKASNEEEVLQLVSKLLQDNSLWPALMAEKRQVFQRFFYGSTGLLASENIIAECLSVQDQLKKTQYEKWRARFGFLPWWYLSRNNRRLFPKQDTQEVENKIRTLAQLLGRRVTPSVTKIGDRMYKVRNTQD